MHHKTLVKIALLITIGIAQTETLSNQKSEIDSINKDSTLIMDEKPNSITTKKDLHMNLGVTGGIGFVNGKYISNTPVGGSLVITTPLGFKVVKIDLRLSLVLGFYNGEGANVPLDALLFGIGANAILFDIVFSESHVGKISSGFGLRSFSGISLERLMKKRLHLPVNILLGGEGFIASKVDNHSKNSTYWGGLGIRLDYSF